MEDSSIPTSTTSDSEESRVSGLNDMVILQKRWSRAAPKGDDGPRGMKERTLEKNAGDEKQPEPIDVLGKIPQRMVST
jgi:hypothetical protein